tara:strand:+ start:15093 stop:15356 length:264 start_codon:yes stop_codon:yes gene_type:complete
MQRCYYNNYKKYKNNKKEELNFFFCKAVFIDFKNKLIQSPIQKISYKNRCILGSSARSCYNNLKLNRNEIKFLFNKGHLISFQKSIF